MINNLTKNIFQITNDVFEPYIAMQIFILNRNGFFLTDTVATQNGFSIENIEDSDIYCFSFYDQICRDTAISILTATDPFSIEYAKKPTVSIERNHQQILITSVSYKNFRILSGHEELVTMIETDDTEDGYNPPAISYMERYRKELNEAQASDQAADEDYDIDALFWEYITFRNKTRVDTKAVTLSKMRSVLSGNNIVGTHASLYNPVYKADYKFSYRINENTPFFLFHFKMKSIAEKAVQVLEPLFSQVLFFVIKDALFIVFDQQKCKEVLQVDTMADFAKSRVFFNRDGVKKKNKKTKRTRKYS